MPVGPPSPRRARRWLSANRCAVRPAIPVIALSLVLCGALSGCGSRGGRAATAAVRASTLPGLGRILVDAGGYTLYVYIFDHRGPSTCRGICAQQWPPLVLAPGVPRPRAGADVNPALLGIDHRPDGALQVTYNGWPLYTYADDGAPGEAAGQADDMGAWYVLSTRGTVDRNPLPRGSSN